MPAPSKPKYPLWLLILIGVAIEVLAILAFSSPTDIHNAIQRERLTTIQDIGVAAEAGIRTSADQLFRHSVVDNGLQATAYISAGADLRPASGSSGLGSGVSSYFVGRLRTLFGTWYLLLYRLAAMGAWVPMLLPLLVAAVIDGVIHRKISHWRFSFASPAVHKIGLYAATLLLVTALVVLLLPIPVSPLFAPVFTFGLSLSFWMIISNAPKYL